MMNELFQPESIPIFHSVIYQKYPDVVTVDQMCEMLGDISSKTAYKLLKENKIHHFKIGRTYKIPKINILLYLNLFDFTSDQNHCDALLH